MISVSHVLRTASRGVLGILFLGVSSVAALATTNTATFQVTANVLPTCQISAGNLNFGDYAGAALTNTSTITVNCTQNQGYDVGLDAGNGGGSVATRKMSGPSGAALGYGLYRDSNHTTNWGNTVGTDTYHGNGSGNAQPLTVYGQLPAAESVMAGAYADTITATITY